MILIIFYILMLMLMMGYFLLGLNWHYKSKLSLTDNGKKSATLFRNICWLSCFMSVPGAVVAGIFPSWTALFLPGISVHVFLIWRLAINSPRMLKEFAAIEIERAQLSEVFQEPTDESRQEAS